MIRLKKIQKMLTMESLVKIEDWLWEIPKKYREDMKVPSRIYASKEMMEDILNDKSTLQIVNVATLPGIQKFALAMPDIHEGYGFPVGGVAAFDINDGIISPGGIGYDINCGVRMLRTNLSIDDLKPKQEDLGYALFREIPSGVGRGGMLELTDDELNKVLENGAEQVVKDGYGTKEDLKNIESNGRLENASAEDVSMHAKSRGRDQLGTLGAGNHFVEVGYVDEIYDEKDAEKLGLKKNQVTILIHTGSRGLGHQIATDYIRKMISAMPKYEIVLPDRELACVPFKSDEGQQYFNAMAAGANYAWANRQLITWEVRKAWSETFGNSGGNLELIYDVAHNLAKVEKHKINGEEKEVVVHRKGATRSFPDQPVLIPGSMGTSSHVLIGQDAAMTETFGSTCHGAGRRMSRTQARKTVRGLELKEELAKRGITIMTKSMKGLAEEAPLAYKDVDNVVNVVHDAGIAKKVARAKPLIVVKG